MSSLTLQELLEAGAHFGHQTKRWNPKMKRFILCPRNGIYIIDLNKTIENLDKFIKRVQAEVEKGGKVLFVGTKKQIKDCVRDEADRCGMPYVTERWLGGMLTNYQTIKQSVAKLVKIETMEKDGTLEALPKKEVLNLMKKKLKLEMILNGIRNMHRTPAIVFIVDATKEHIAISESRRLGIPIGAIIDTNCDPDPIDFPIPGNDDAIKSVQLITRAISDAILNASKNFRAEEMIPAKERPVASADTDTVPESLLDLPPELVDADEGVDGAKTNTAIRRVVRKKIIKAVDE
jgi:small subunit ribosomal protein S2